MITFFISFSDDITLKKSLELLQASLSHGSKLKNTRNTQVPSESATQ